MLINFIIELHYLSGFIKFLIRWNGLLFIMKVIKKLFFLLIFPKLKKLMKKKFLNLKVIEFWDREQRLEEIKVKYLEMDENKNNNHENKEEEKNNEEKKENENNEDIKNEIMMI